MNLNDKQRAAVESDAKRLLIVAGPGTGKTHTLTARIGYFLNHRKISGSQILALTFTRKAATELKTRLYDTCHESKVDKITACTFHALCLQMIRSYAFTLGYKGDELSIYDEVDRKDLITRLCYRMESGAKAKKLIKEVMKYADDCACQKEITPLSMEAESVTVAYDHDMKNTNSLDFDMLVSTTARLLKTDADARAYYQNLFKYIFVDEYQDTDKLQQQLIDLLLGEDSELSCVGDDDQLLYSWRGADSSIMMNFQRRYPDADRVTLSINYRSTPQIIEVANRLIGHNQRRLGKTLLPNTSVPEKDCPSPVVIGFNDQNSEANSISKSIGSIKLNYPERSIAVLARTNFYLQPIANELDKIGIAYQLISPFDVWKSIAVKRTIDLLRLAVNPFDDTACVRLLEYIYSADDEQVQTLKVIQSQESITMYEAMVSQNAYVALSDIFSALNVLVELKGNHIKALGLCLQFFTNIQRFGDDDKRYLKELIEKTFDQYHGTVSGFLQWAATRRVEDEVKDDDENTVKLMTVHTAKGLEFDHVYLVGCIEGKFPMTRKDSDIEEERRIFYVGQTRAKERLVMTCPQEIQYAKYSKKTEPSRFISESGL